MTTHELKTFPHYFAAVLRGDKTFEIRRDDRGFNAGDRLVLQEWDGEDYTGREIEADVTYVTGFEQKVDYVVMAIRVREAA